MTSRTTSRAVLALALAASLVACGGEEGGDDPTLSQPSASATTSAPRSSPPAPSAQPCQERPPTAPAPAGAITDLKTKPTVQPDDAPPPCGLVIRDIVVGTGPEAVATSTVQVKYVGAFYETGEEFDSSWAGGPDEVVTFPLDRVIPGFKEGITGMKVGGRRQVTVPSDLGYGDRGSPPTIPGGATLVFVIDLVALGPQG